MLAEAYEQFYKTLEKDMGDRTKTVGASEIGSCARQTFWVKNKGTRKGVDEDDDYEHDWGARVRGTVMEQAFWEPALRAKYGANFVHAQTKFIKGYLSATPDGLLINQPYDALKHLGVKSIKSDCFTVEGKTIDPRTNLVEAKETNIYQINSQLGLIRDLTPHKPEYGLLTYTDASFWSEVDEFPVKFDPFMYDAAHTRAADIMTAKHGRELAPEGWISGGKECSFCPFVKACGVERRGIPKGSKQASPQFAAEMEDTAKAYNKIKLSLTKQEAQLKSMEVDIKTRLRTKGVRRIPNVVNWYDVAAPKRYANKKIREAYIEAGGDIEEFSSLGEPSDRLVIAATPAASRVVKTDMRKRGRLRTIARPNRAKAKTRNAKSNTEKLDKAQFGKTLHKRPRAKVRSKRVKGKERKHG